MDHVHGVTALQLACRNGDTERVINYINDGLTENMILRKDACGETALHDSIKNGNLG